MKIITVRDYAEMSDIGAEIILEQILKKNDSVLGLATGSTPIGLYDNLVKAYRAGRVSFAKVKTVNLDEYVGLGEEDTQSYVYFMRKRLFSRIDVDLKNTHLPNGKAEDLKKECERYTRLLKSMPQDIQLLGLGANGHIGFNEPYSSFGGHTHEVELSKKTISDNSRLFNSIDEVPRFAVTMGIADIMQAKSILMLACGENKAQAVRAMLKDDVAEACPASVLQRHKNAVLIIDEQAAKLL